MLGLLIANLVMTSLVFLAIGAAGIRVIVLSVRANAQRNRRRSIDPDTVKAAAAALMKLANSSKTKSPGNVAEFRREKEA